MKRSAVVWTASIVVVALGLGGRAGAQNIEILPPDAPPPRRSPAPSPEAPPEVTPATPPEGAPAAPPDGSPPAEAPATGPPEAPARPRGRPGRGGRLWRGLALRDLARARGRVRPRLADAVILRPVLRDGADNSTTASNFSLFGVPNTGALAAFSFPRVAFDLFVAPNFSVGIGLGALYGSSSATPSGSDATTHSFTGLLAAPRVGYALNLATDITLWARGGISVAYSKVETGGRIQRRASVEPPGGRDHRAASRVHGAATIGAHGRPHAGHHVQRPRRDDRTTTQSYDEHVTELGIQGGVLIHL